MVNKRRKKKKVMFYAKKGEIERTDFDDGSRSISVTPDNLDLMTPEELDEFEEALESEESD